MKESYFLDAIRSLFAALDKAIYGFISVFYNVMLSISKISILNIDQINEFASKIYALLAVFMVFKITFSLINYLVNPEKVFDSSKGVQKILVNIVIVLGMIIITPTAFTKLYEIQNAILDDNIIPKFILGNVTTQNNVVISQLCYGSVTIEDEGEKFAVTIFTSFYQPEWSRSKPGISYKDYVESDFNKKNQITTEWLKEGKADNYCNSTSIKKLLDIDIVNSAPKNFDDLYIIDYQFFISTVVGVAVLILLVSFCFDIAVRSIRLAFLQLIAPIPIISYIDPDSSKNGMFKKWLKDVGKTWTSLFIRLISIYFAIYLIDIIVDNMGTFKDIKGNPIATSYSPVVNIFLLIGILMFAKKLPSLIEGILGIKLDGKFEMNPLKRIANDAIGGKQIAGFATGTLSKAGALAVNKMKGKNWRDSWDASKEAFAAGYKSPGTMAGYKAGIKQLQEDKKTRRTAETKLKNYDDMNKKGRKLLEQSFVYDENGKHEMKTKKIIDKNGKEIEIKTNEYKTDDSRIFSNQAYKKSFQNVEELKGKKIQAENNYDAKDKLYAAALQTYGIDSVQAQQAKLEREAAKKELAAATGKFDLAVKQHDEYKKIYKDDAEREETLSFYKKTHADELEAPKEDNDSVDNNLNNNSATDSDSLTSQNIIDDDSSDDYDYDDMEDIFDSQYEDENEELFEESQNETEVNDDTQSEEKLDESVIRTFEQNEQNVKQIEKEIENKRKQYEELRDKVDDEINPKKAEEYREKMSNAANEMDELMLKQNMLIKNEMNYYDEHPKEAISKFRRKAEEAKKIAKEAERKIEILQKQLENMDYSTPHYASLKEQYDKLVEQKDYYYSRTDKYLDKVKDLENKNK